MLRKLALLILAAAPVAYAQGPSADFQPPVGGWYFTGTSYAPITTTGTAGQLADYQPAVGLWGYNTTTKKWYPCGPSNPCFAGGGSGSGTVSPSTSTSPQVYGTTSNGSTTVAPLTATQIQSVIGTGFYDIGRYYNAVIDGVAVCDGTTDDKTALINAGNAAQTANKTLLIPRLCAASGTVTWATTAKPFSVECSWTAAGVASTSTTADVVVIGSGTNTTGQLVNGFAKGCTFRGPTSNSPPAANGQAAFKLSGMTQFSVENVSTSYTDIGFDGINNNYGEVLHNVRAGFGGTNNIGWNVRTGIQSGNQLSAEDSWLGGVHAAVQISGGADGIRIHGGQLGQYNPAGNVDTDAAVVYGSDYLTGTAGGVGNVRLDTVDFEQITGWEFRGFGPGILNVTSSDFLANGSTFKTIGILKATNAQTSTYAFENNEIGGSAGFSSSTPISIAGDYGASLLQSSGWQSSTSLSFNGTSWNTNYGVDPCVISNTNSASIGVHCIATYRPANTSITTTYQEGLFTQYNAASNVMQYSTNAASASPVWTNVITNAALTNGTLTPNFSTMTAGGGVYSNAALNGVVISNAINTTSQASSTSSVSFLASGNQNIQTISGTAAMQTVAAPYYFNSNQGGYVFVTASGAWSTITGGNISTVCQAVSGQTYLWFWTGTSWFISGPGCLAPVRFTSVNVVGDVGQSKSLTVQTAAIASTNLVAAANVTAASQWVVNWYLDSTVVCATPGSASASLTITFTDETGVRSQTTGNVALGATGTSNQNGGSIVLWSASGAAINYSTSYVACTSGTGTYALRLAASQVQ